MEQGRLWGARMRLGFNLLSIFTAVPLAFLRGVWHRPKDLQHKSISAAWKVPAVSTHRIRQHPQSRAAHLEMLAHRQAQDMRLAGQSKTVQIRVV